jgi:hypothetical protein
MEDAFPGFTQLSDQEKVKLILSDPTICSVSAKFIADINEDSLNKKYSPSPNFVDNVSLLMLIITLFTLGFCDGHVNDFYTE